MSARPVLVANPENRRAAFFQAALARAGLPPATVVPWLALLRGEADLAAAIEPGSLVRFESPGEDDDVERALIALGGGGAAALGLPRDRGRILHPRRWLVGWRAALARCEDALRRAAPHELLNAPEDIAVMFDKPACHARLVACGVPVAPALGSVEEPIAGWEDLRARMTARGEPRVFVKLAGGSSASGVVALETGGARVQAHTSVELVREAGEVRLYNSLRVRRYTDEDDVALIVDALCREGVHVERWLPKATLDGRRLDLRVVVIGGRARQVVVRSSRTPLTNLHLGNRRGDPAAVRARLGEAAWAAALAAAEAALAAFPRSRYAGVDLLIGSTFRRHAVLEVNAFGDFVTGPLSPEEAAKVSPWSEWLASTVVGRPGEPPGARRPWPA